MKINIWIIISDHIATLRNARNGGISYLDLGIFFGVPFIFAILAFDSRLKFPDDFSSLSITFFGIFIALLLNMQLAIYGIHQKGQPRNSANQRNEIDEKEYCLKRTLMAELNASISYLTLISTVALVLSFLHFILHIEQPFFVPISVFLYTHFALTLLMVLKRSYILFKKEFS